MIEYSPLDTSQLGADAQKALGSAPGKMMAARGMAPIANPSDLASVLYQLCLDTDAKIAESAKSAAKGLPSGILQGALSSPALDARVIDYFVHHERVLINPALKIPQGNVVRENCAARAGMQAAGQQKNTVIKATLEPDVMRLHMLAGLRWVSREFEQYNEHFFDPFWWFSWSLSKLFNG